MLGLGAKWIINYPDISDKWPVRLDTSLTQSEVNSLELKGFVLKNGMELEVPCVTPISNVFLRKVPATVDVTPCEVPKDTYVFPLDISLQFVLDHCQVLGIPNLILTKSRLDGNKRPSMQDRKPF